ncbi:hypothetical protein L596_028420 [Steinernema carpocapsae]|uniref:Uncharacterized protein n=1 Tax=Steinernema carpocapsae TaxID=34508 RepID=A0A4U5LYD2_STECR|nr:hypothetical protein L596_028420 [Steinernema carpocapsae]
MHLPAEPNHQRILHLRAHQPGRAGLDSDQWRPEQHHQRKPVVLQQQLVQVPQAVHPGMFSIPLDFHLQALFGGRMTDAVKYNDTVNTVEVPSDNRRGFRYNVRNVPYMTTPIGDRSTSSAHCSGLSLLF